MTAIFTSTDYTPSGTDGTERDLIANSTSITPATTVVDAEFVIDLSAMAAGDQFRFRLLEKPISGGTAAPIYEAWRTGAQTKPLTIPRHILANGWNVTAKRFVGASSRVFSLSQRNYNLSPDVNVSKWLASTPAALDASGYVKADVATIDASVITATAIASGAITAAKFATDAIDANALKTDAVTEIQSGLATSTALGTAQTAITDIQARLPTALVSGRIDASVGAMAANVVTAAAIATDAIDADALKADAVTEIQSGLATSTALAAVQTDTDDIQTRLPAALVGGRIDASVGAMAANVVTAAAIATDAIDADSLKADAVTEIQSGLATSAALTTAQTDLDDIQTRLPAALVSGRIDASVGAMAANTLTASALATDAVTEIQSGLATSAALTTVGGYIDTEITTLLDQTTSGAIADAVWNAVAASFNSEATMGEAAQAEGGGGGGGSSAEDVRDAILDYEFRSGRTVRGFFRRLDAFAAGSATGLRGLVARFFGPNGEEEIVASQNRTKGTRAAPNVSASEVP